MLSRLILIYLTPVYVSPLCSKWTFMSPVKQCYSYVIKYIMICHRRVKNYYCLQYNGPPSADGLSETNGCNVFRYLNECIARTVLSVGALR